MASKRRRSGSPSRRGGGVGERCSGSEAPSPSPPPPPPRPQDDLLIENEKSKNLVRCLFYIISLTQISKQCLCQTGSRGIVHCPVKNSLFGKKK